jgi:Ca2+-binding RTX toxin-like protein
MIDAAERARQYPIMDVEGTPASERLEGTSDADFIFGFGGDDTLVGGAGDDWLEGGAGANLLDGGAGDDNLDGGADANVSTVQGGEGNDTLWASDGNEVLEGGPGDDVFKVLSGRTSFEARGGEGRDVYIPSDPGFDRDFRVVDFRAGADGDLVDVVSTLMTEANLFNDYVGGNPFDPLVGFLKIEQQGADAVLLFNRGAAGGVDQWTRVLTLAGTSAAEMTVENFLGGIPPDGAWLAGRLVEGGFGNDRLQGGFFGDTLDGSAGDDLVAALGGDDVVDGAEGNDVLVGGWGNDTLRGGYGNDTLRSNDGFDVAAGGYGEDVFKLGTKEYLDARYPATRDDFSMHGATTVTTGPDRDIVELHRIAEGGTHTITDFEAGEDVIDAGSLLDVSSSFGYAGGNPFAASRGFLRLTDISGGTQLEWDPDGAAGSQFGWITAVMISGVAASSLEYSFAGGFPLDGSEPINLHLTGTSGDDTFFGAGGHETLLGYEGDDVLDAGIGEDIVDGGVGNDTLYGGIGDDTLIGDGGDDWFQSDDGEHNTQGDDLISGGDGNDRFFDVHGNNTLEGGDGDDWFSLQTFDYGRNLATGGAGRDTFSPSAEGNSVVTDFEAGTGGDFIYPAFLVGAQGLDGRHPFIAGYLRLAGDPNGGTLLQYDTDGPTGRSGWVTVLTLQGVRPRDITTENFLGRFLVGSADNDLLVGSWTDDVLQGLAGDDTLDGGAGSDTMEGGSGNDLFYVDDDGDLVIEAGLSAAPPGAAADSIGQGVDKVVASISYSLAQFVENLAMARGVAGLVGQGNALANVLTASDAGSQLKGHEGDDTLVGLAGNDMLTGGDGADSFEIVAAAGARDTIEDFSPTAGDTLKIDGAALAELDFLVEQRDADGDGDLDTVLTLEGDNGWSLLLRDVRNFAADDDNDYGPSPGVPPADDPPTAEDPPPDDDEIVDPVDALLEGTPGADTLSGGTGNDTLSGGAGIDTGVYQSDRSAYRVEKTAAGFVVTDLTGNEGRDELAGVERLQFADGKFAFDVEGNAGMAGRLIAAVLGADPGSEPLIVGICLRFLDGGGAGEALVEAGLNYLLGHARTNADVVRLLYANVTGTVPPQEALDHFVGLLETGTYTQASLGLMAAQLELTGTQLALAQWAQAGLAYV